MSWRFYHSLYWKRVSCNFTFYTLIYRTKTALRSFSHCVPEVIGCVCVSVAGWLTSAVCLYVDEAWTHHRGCGWPRAEKVQQADTSRWLWRLLGQERQCKHPALLSSTPPPHHSVRSHVDTWLKSEASLDPQLLGRRYFNAMYLTLGGVETVQRWIPNPPLTFPQPFLYLFVFEVVVVDLQC